MPTTNSGKSPQTAEEYAAARAKSRFFAETKVRLETIVYLVEVELFSAAHDATVILHQEFIAEANRREAVRTQQLELEGLLTASNTSASFCFGGES